MVNPVLSSASITPGTWLCSRSPMRVMGWCRFSSRLSSSQNPSLQQALGKDNWVDQSQVPKTYTVDCGLLTSGTSSLYKPWHCRGARPQESTFRTMENAVLHSYACQEPGLQHSPNSNPSAAVLMVLVAIFFSFSLSTQVICQTWLPSTPALSEATAEYEPHSPLREWE